MNSGSAERKQTLRLKIDNRVNFRLVGISSHENDYRLVWAVNEEMKMQFVRTHNLVIHESRLNHDLEFGCYTCQDEDRYLGFHLISNRCPDGFLFAELKNFDFLLRITGEMNETEMGNLIKSLRKISIIAGAYTIDTGKIRQIQKLQID